MVASRTFLAGLIFGVLLCGCAGVAFRHYGLSGIRFEEGQLLGPSPKYDLPFSLCKPDEIPDPENPGKIKLRHKCVVMFETEFHALKADYQATKAELAYCQRWGRN